MADKFSLDGDEIEIFDTEVRRSRKNEYVSFVQPLQSDPKSSIYNLKRIKTVYLIKGYVRTDQIRRDDFSKYDWDGDSTTEHTLDSMMLSSSPITFTWQNTAISGYIRDYNIVENANTIKGYSDGAEREYIQVEVVFERGESI